MTEQTPEKDGSACVFCEIVAGRAPATFVEQSGAHVAFEPLGPQTPGHVLFVPREHVADAAQNPGVTGYVMEQAARYAADVGPANIITSIGAEATQSVFHLHVHVLPRGARDGLRPSWPWVRPHALRPGQTGVEQ